jgi:hypothetical protein
MAITGRFNFRRTFTGKILLQVEEDVKRIWPFSRSSATKRRWRNATLMDLTCPEMRPLMDLRHKPRFEWERVDEPVVELPRKTSANDASPTSVEVDISPRLRKTS